MLYFWKRVNAEGMDPELKPVMTKLCTLFGLWSVEKHLGTLYEGMFVLFLDCRESFTVSNISGVAKEGLGIQTLPQEGK
jgi:hypothetical protein